MSSGTAAAVGWRCGHQLARCEVVPFGCASHSRLRAATRHRLCQQLMTELECVMPLHPKLPKFENGCTRATSSANEGDCVRQRLRNWNSLFSGSKRPSSEHQMCQNSLQCLYTRTRMVKNLDAGDALAGRCILACSCMLSCLEPRKRALNANTLLLFEAQVAETALLIVYIHVQRLFFSNSYL